MGQRVPPENTGPHRPFRQRPRLHLSPRFETGFGSFSPDPHNESIPADCREYRAFIVLQSLPGRSLHLECRLMHVVRLHEVQRMRRTKSVLCLCRVTVASPPCDASDASLKTRSYPITSDSPSLIRTRCILFWPLLLPGPKSCLVPNRHSH